MAFLAVLATKAVAAVKTASLGTILSGAGTAISTVGAIQAGNANKAAANYQAAQLDAAAKTERASAQRQAQEERRQKELLISRARAVGAASGGGQDYGLIGSIEEDGTLRELTALWQGEEAAKGREQQAASARFDGKQAKKASVFKAATTLMSGGASLYDRYA